MVLHKSHCWLAPSSKPRNRPPCVFGNSPCKGRNRHRSKRRTLEERMWASLEHSQLQSLMEADWDSNKLGKRACHQQGMQCRGDCTEDHGFLSNTLHID